MKTNTNTRMKSPAHLPRRLGSLATALVLTGWLCCFGVASQAAEHRIPVIKEPWTQIAGDPDLGDLTSKNQQPVDFGIWQAADGTWQLWSCIRNTKEPGRTRLFYRWEGAKLTDANWKPMGIAMQADTKVGELAGGLQAPYVFKTGGHHEMFYGGWEDICSATSTDGKKFKRRLNSDGKATLFRSPDGYAQTRDPMLIRIGDLWHCYYTAHTGKAGADFCRTSKDLRMWSEARMVAAGGQSGSGNFSAECPFVVELAPGQLYLFRTQHYGKNQQTSVYFSRDPMDFGVDHDEGHFVCTLPVAAPEIIRYEGQYYIAALLPSLKGIQIARLEWVVADQNSLTSDETAAGWKLLFDGRTLTGWHGFQQKSPPKTGWHVADGCLVNPKSNGRPNGSGGDIVTDAKYLDFEFRFEWRISPAGNSGVHYLIDESRPPTVPLYIGDTGHSPVGFEYQVLDDERHPDGKRGPTHKAGALYDLFATEKKTLRPVGEWNEGRIIVNGKHIEHWLNDAKVAECDLDTDEFRATLAKSKYHVVPGFGTKIATPLALQDHGEEVAFRNLKILELHPQ